MSAYLYSYDVSNYASDEYIQERLSKPTSPDPCFMMFIRQILRTKPLQNVILQLILFGNALVQILCNVLNTQKVLATKASLMQSKYDNITLKIAATFVIMVGLLAHMQCASASPYLNPQPECHPQPVGLPPLCMPCGNTHYYFDDRINSCEVCLQCPPGLEPDKPCGPDARCILCSNNQFSDKFDQDACYPCQKCDNTVNDVPCTTTSDRKCGPCAPGYGYADQSHKDKCIQCKKLGRLGVTQASCKISTTTVVIQPKPTTVITTKSDPTTLVVTQSISTTVATTRANPTKLAVTQVNSTTAVTTQAKPTNVTTKQANPKPTTIGDKGKIHKEDEHETVDETEKHFPTGKYHLGGRLSGLGKMVIILVAVGIIAVVIILILIVCAIYKIKYINYRQVTGNPNRIRDGRPDNSPGITDSKEVADKNLQMSTTIHRNSIFHDVQQDSTNLDFTNLRQYDLSPTSKVECVRKLSKECVRRISKSESSSALLGDSDSEERVKKEISSPGKSLSSHGGPLGKCDSLSLDGIVIDLNFSERSPESHERENGEENQGGDWSLNSKDTHPATNQTRAQPKDSQDYYDGEQGTSDSFANDPTLPTTNSTMYPIQASQSDSFPNQKLACALQQTAKVQNKSVQSRRSASVSETSTCSMKPIVDQPESAHRKPSTRIDRTTIQPLRTRLARNSSDPRSFSSPPLFAAPGLTHQNPFWPTPVDYISCLVGNTPPIADDEAKMNMMNSNSTHHTRRKSMHNPPPSCPPQTRHEPNLRDTRMTPQPSSPVLPERPLEGTKFSNCTFNGTVVLASNSQHSSYVIGETINNNNPDPNGAAS